MFTGFRWSIGGQPGAFYAHDHGRAIRSSSIGAAGKPLESWLHHLAPFSSVDPYLGAVVALSNSALGGAGVVMMHYTRVQGFNNLPDEVTEVARAARDVGVRVGFAGGWHFAFVPTVDEVIANGSQRGGALCGGRR